MTHRQAMLAVLVCALLAAGLSTAATYALLTPKINAAEDQARQARHVAKTTSAEDDNCRDGSGKLADSSFDWEDDCSSTALADAMKDLSSQIEHVCDELEVTAALQDLSCP